jgi:WD40 repeat protein
MTCSQILRAVSSSCILVALFVSSAFGRTWTDRAGTFKAEAALVTVRDGKAYLETPDGQVTAIALERLSIEDLTFIASLPEYQSQIKPLLLANNSPRTTTTPPVPSEGIKMATIEVDSPSHSGSIRQFRSERWGYKGLKFSPDGAYLVTLGSDNITVMDINASTKMAYDIGSDTRSAMAFSVDGKRLFIGSSDGKVLVWQFDVQGKLKPEREFIIHREPILAIVASPDKQHVITLHGSGTACLWNVDSGEVLARFNDFQFLACRDALFSRQGGQAIITDGQIAAVLDVLNRKIVQRMSLPKGSGQFAVIAFDGSAISVGRTYDIQTVETQKEKAPLISEGKEISWCAAFSPRGMRIISGGLAHVTLWNRETGMPIQKFPLSESGYVQYVAFSPDGIHFAAIGAPIGTLVEVFRLPSEHTGQ